MSGVGVTVSRSARCVIVIAHLKHICIVFTNLAFFVIFIFIFLKGGNKRGSLPPNCFADRLTVIRD